MTSPVAATAVAIEPPAGTVHRSFPVRKVHRVHAPARVPYVRGVARHRHPGAHRPDARTGGQLDRIPQAPVRGEIDGHQLGECWPPSSRVTDSQRPAARRRARRCRRRRITPSLRIDDRRLPVHLRDRGGHRGAEHALHAERLRPGAQIHAEHLVGADAYGRVGSGIDHGGGQPELTVGAPGCDGQGPGLSVRGRGRIGGRPRVRRVSPDLGPPRRALDARRGGRPHHGHQAQRRPDDKRGRAAGVQGRVILGVARRRRACAVTPRRPGRGGSSS